jgi:hypothetical protein
MGRIPKKWLRGPRLLAAIVVIFCGLVVYFVWFARREEDLPTTAQVMAMEAAQPAEIAVGGNVQVSAALGVNQDGVVAVSWYDRRGLPDIKGNRGPQYGAGCNVRVRLSLDGGTSWQSSVQVNEKPIRATVWELRDSAGLTADTAGVFHPLWIDDRTGVLQVWTAAVKVGKR